MILPTYEGMRERATEGPLLVYFILLYSIQKLGVVKEKATAHKVATYIFTEQVNKHEREHIPILLLKTIEAQHR